MRVLVTGGGGFIGSHVVDRLIDRGDTPRIFDLSASPYHSPLEVETFTGSITDPANLDLAMRDCDAVIHLAAVADVAHVLADPVLAEEVNTRGTLNVLEAACRVEVDRVVYGSTTWVYSDCAEQAVDEETPIPAPRHLYTATKLAGETYCAGYAELYDLEYTVLRFGIPYGPRARAAGVVAKFTDLALAGEPLTIAGDGSQTRSFIYVEDLADGIVAALAPAAAGRTYNLSGDEVVTILEIAERVQEMTGGCEIVHTPPRPGDFPARRSPTQRALEELGWKAETSFRDGVRRTSSGCAGRPAPPDPVPGQTAHPQRRRHGNGNGRPGCRRARRGPREEQRAAARAGDHRRHRRGPRPARADHQGRHRAGGSRRRGRDRQRARGDGPDRRLGRPRRFARDLPLDAVAVRHPVLADHEIRPDPMADAPPRLRARRPRPAAVDRRARPDVVISTYPGVTAVLGMLRENRRLRSRSSRRSPTSPGCATGFTRGSTSTSSPIPSRSRKSRGWPGRRASSGRGRRSHASS